MAPKIVEHTSIIKDNPMASTNDPWIVFNDDLIGLSTTTPAPRVKFASNPTTKHTAYPKRNNMGECPPLYGKVTVFVAFAETSYKT